VIKTTDNLDKRIRKSWRIIYIYTSCLQEAEKSREVGVEATKSTDDNHPPKEFQK